MITSIKRDFNLFPNLVGIVTTDNLATITAANYFTSQLAAVLLLNNGTWEWEIQDYVLIYYATGQIGFFTYDATTDAFVVSRPPVIPPAPPFTVALTAAQIIAMSATPVLLIPAPGVGFANVINSILWNITYGSVQFTGGGNIAAQYGNTALGAGPAASTVIAGATLDAVAANTILTQAPSVINTAETNMDNKAIYLSNTTAPFAAGNSTAILTIIYHTVAI